ncbi:MAG: transposase, partial [Elusimicrobiota bacterium]
MLPIRYKVDPNLRGLTALGGLPLYLELAHVAGLVEAIRNNLCVRAQGDGWSDVQVVMALILLNLAGGSAVDDIEHLGEDEGFVEILRRAQLQHLRRHERRELERAWRKGKKLSVPSPTAVLRYLKAFHDEEQEKERVPGRAFIPTPNQHLREIVEVHRAFLAFVQKRNPCETATMDTDATVMETHKASALFSYKGFKAYQPLNVWWAEQGLVLHTEFRDGNVPAGFEILRVVQEALALLPEGVKKVRVRSDTAGYQHEFLQWMGAGDEVVPSDAGRAVQA